MRLVMDWSSWGDIVTNESEQEKPVQESSRCIVTVATVAGFSIFVAMAALSAFMLQLIGTY